MNITVQTEENRVLFINDNELIIGNLNLLINKIAHNTASLGDDDYKNCYNKELLLLNSNENYLINELKQLTINELN